VLMRTDTCRHAKARLTGPSRGAAQVRTSGIQRRSQVQQVGAGFCTILIVTCT
jgi:hypothetical protein